MYRESPFVYRKSEFVYTKDVSVLRYVPPSLKRKQELVDAFSVAAIQQQPDQLYWADVQIGDAKAEHLFSKAAMAGPSHTPQWAVTLLALDLSNCGLSTFPLAVAGGRP